MLSYEAERNISEKLHRILFSCKDEKLRFDTCTLSYIPVIL